MIKFANVSKTYHIRKFEKHVLTDLDFTLEKGESIGICGANGAGKSTLLKLMSGVEQPSTGTVTRTMSTSWPLGYGSTFQSGLTGADNARIYNRPEEELLEYVEDFAQLGPYLNQPLNTYSAGMGARLAFGISLAIEFECYLIDEVTAAGDDRFRARSRAELLERRDRASLAMTSHDANTLMNCTTRGAVPYGGSLILYDIIEEAVEVHHRLQSRAA